ncbi:MAG: pyruvate formate lyase activating enzyme [Patescibacteria group bacterium]|nr:pyruvate formate lyase activating enzyme [Patescibacteria group bacterium]
MKLFKKSKQNQIQCLACYNYCLISDGKTGLCGVRQNKKGELKLLVDNKVAAVNLDPIEKKPFFHFLPGTFAFSLGTFGCNFSCEFCQNWDISQAPKIQNTEYRIQDTGYWGEDWPPEKIINYCQNNNISTIAYTYNEPTVWTEYALKTMKLAKKVKINPSTTLRINGEQSRTIKNIWVSNGYFSPQTLKLIAPYLDAINIDLKSYREDFYHKIIHASLAPVKKNIQEVWKLGIWEEVTTLLIPTLNDSTEELKQMANFLVEISPDLPWHLSAFYPAYHLFTLPPTPQKTLIKAYQIGKNAGLRYIYTGNIPDQNYESTYCPNCGEKMIERWGIEMIKNNLKDGKCPKCGEKISGRWKL